MKIYLVYAQGWEECDHLAIVGSLSEAMELHSEQANRIEEWEVGKKKPEMAWMWCCDQPHKSYEFDKCENDQWIQA